MDNQEEIIVYDNFKIDIIKYPRINTDKEKTDIVIIIFLMHEDYLKKIAESLEKSLKYYQECKEYYFIFNFNKENKKYSAQDIILLYKNTTDFFRSNSNITIQLSYLKNMQKIDIIFYFYLKNKDFYLSLYESLEHAKKSYFERRDYSYKISPPTDFFNKIFEKTYSAIEIMELNAYTQYLVKRKIIKELPLPKYI